jgi:ribosomal protein S18 acetylase RimI-like enzyme
MGDVSFRLKRVDSQDPKVWARIVTMDAHCFDKEEAPALADNSGVWWICYADDQAAGYCTIREKSPGVGYISRVGVLTRFRGNGLQKKMMRCALGHARAVGWKSVVSDTANNIPSANSFISLGFKLFQPNEPWGLREALYWRKVLEQ